jgi:hypothetical protein
MKESINEVKSEVNAKLRYWNNIQSKKNKIALLLVFIGGVALKVFTTVLTFDWLTSFFN